MRGDGQDLSMSLAQLRINSMESRGQPGSANTATVFWSILSILSSVSCSFCFLNSTSAIGDDILN